MDLEDSLRVLRERAAREAGEPDSEEAKARREAAQKGFMEFLSTVFGVLGIAMGLAAPRALAKGRIDDFKTMTQARILGLVDDYLARIDRYKAGERAGVDPRMLQSEDAVRRLRSLLATWQFGPVAPEPLVRTAREILAAFELTASDEEWDQWEGPSEPGASNDGASGAGC